MIGMFQFSKMMNRQPWAIKQYICNFNSSPPEQNDRHFADDIFICIFANEKLCILFKI